VEYSEGSPPPGDGMVGFPVPPFAALASDGRRIDTNSCRGKVLLIQLWGVNCSSCLEEMSFLEADIYPRYRDRGLVIWGVNADQIGRDAMVAGLARIKASASYPLVVDPVGEITRLFTTWFIPVTVLVDTRGVVQYYKIGFNQADRETVRSRIESLLP
jgi:peroxiredoxin